MKVKGAILLILVCVGVAGCSAHFSLPPTARTGIAGDTVEIVANDLVADPMAIGPVSGEGKVRRWFWVIFTGDTGYYFDVGQESPWWLRLFGCGGQLMAVRAAYYRAADPTGCDMLIFARSEVDTYSILGFYKEFYAKVRGQGVQMHYGVERKPRERNVRDLIRARGKDTIVGTRPNLVRDVEATAKTLGE